MKTAPIVPARIDFDTVAGRPYAPDFGDRYASSEGAIAQAAHVFLGGTDLPRRWAGKRRFVILETGFGLGNNLLATWDAWQRDPARCEQLVFVSIDRHPPSRADLIRAHADAPLRALSDRLIDAWPPLTPNLHLLDFGALRVVLGFGDIAALLPQLRLRADAIYLDGFAPDRNPAMWEPRVLKAIGRLAATDATLATWSIARAVHDGLRSAGFAVHRGPGFAQRHAMTQARHAPAFVRRRAEPATPALREAVIVGAGVAGCCTAAALARLGWRCVVIDRESGAGASAPPAAVFHGTVHADDGPHARFTRAAALRAHQIYGATGGLRRVGPAAPIDGLPPEYVQRDGAALLDALLYPGGGWVEPRDWLARWLAVPGIETRWSTSVQALRHEGAGWACIDARGTAIVTAPVVVLANAFEAERLVRPLGVPATPTERVRGQTTRFASASRLLLPHAGDGYAIDTGRNEIVCGATAQPGDDDAAVRDADHAINLERLHRLTGITPAADAVLRGHVGWRERSADRLPIVGGVPSPDFARAPRLDQVRFVPRVPGLWRIGALGGRGYTWAPLAAEVLAAQIDAAPVPLEADLQDAIDPARWIVRAARLTR